MNLKDLYSKSTAGMKTSMIREMLAQTKGVPGMISFAGGFPSPATFPVNTLNELFQEVVTESGSDTLQYGASEGDNELKKALISWENVSLDTDELLITNGATNGIYYFTRTLINPGDVILCEGPTFLGSVVSFEASGAEVISIDMDNQGIQLDLLEDKIKELKSIGKTIKFFYTIPDFQNPTGITMSLERRHDLIKLMQKEQILILEDDPYGELRYSGEKVKSLIEIARNEYNDKKIVTTVKSFSKILGPGLRMAYVMADKELIKPMCSWLQKVIVNPEGVTQRVVAKYISKGYLEEHIKSIREFYKPYQVAIIDALTKYMPNEIEFTKPEGGIFIWLKTKKDINFDELFSEIVKEKVCYIPGSKFYPEHYEQYNCLRLNFSYPTIEQIYDGIKILSEKIQTELSKL
ncbi:MAG: PLP-dependent aminotransferase family protein [Candidatus Cloacimonetes bacterium]|nr:PLP-dependent aminotransferase family protein [Candidatus Cloacimonadota bacterium]MDD4155977.1 PLP-dependent aminotransferase family protein [Candidatus Cloacimonadota bacterium]